MIPASAWPRERGRRRGGTGMRHSGDPTASFAVVSVFSRLSRRRHIDLQRSTSCLCQV
ncbi:putative leader peptide [Streptomyces sp. NPDC048277]|uniref:putative leader peptide n=1 Tax=Streptomyces sp. NPDC048277 TaxID=3155027 RepID=UPI0033E2CACF